eukprot:CAMPEP_0114490328 /NCGR_PEP_ID=MMETSP0109-20121206/2385_1 /TAXON_ID=29199 /ORGANISM="Chlorarachnion reptans, Strain CCCM449" /LENGTH=90 /DNA_ID=CAMNT_0001666941 /DNA_START=77 /DNA_END=349 /DNA_ORIENTATION=-
MGMIPTDDGKKDAETENAAFVSTGAGNGAGDARNSIGNNETKGIDGGSDVGCGRSIDDYDEGDDEGRLAAAKTDSDDGQVEEGEKETTEP